MWLTLTVLIGIVVSPATPASLSVLLAPSSLALPQGQNTPNQALNEQLVEAVRAGDTEKTRALLLSGANADYQFGEPLTAAVNRNDTTMARILIEAGAKVNHGIPLLPLATAVAGDHLEMIRLLLSLGANVNGTGPGESPLSMALFMNRLDAAKILIAAGADAKAEKAYAESHHYAGSLKALEKALGATPPPMTVEQVVNTLEADSDSMDLGEQPKDSEHPTQADVANTVSELGSRLKTKPQDTPTLLLWARFALIPEPSILATGYEPPASKTEFLPADVALDRVLATEPHNAEALYLKGRLSVGVVRADEVGFEQKGLERAIPLLRQAAEYAPDNLKYREFLALFLADAGRPGEGKDVLRAAQKNHPMIPLLEDLEAVSAPEGGEYFVGHAISMSIMEAMGNAGIADHLHLRLRTYLYTKNVSQIEAFYASRFPGFRFLPANKRRRQLNEEDGGEKAYLQFLHGKSGGMKASRQRSEVPDPAVAKDGFLMIAIEKNDDPSGTRKLPPGERGCYLVLVNYRK